MRVSVVIPTYNEAQSIGRVLDDIPWSEVSEVLVVDSDSSDGTRDIAAGRGARVVLEPERGYGRACLTGIAQAASPDVVVFLDGDYSDRPAELPRLLEPLRADRGDIVIGSRLAGDLDRPGSEPRRGRVPRRRLQRPSGRAATPARAAARRPRGHRDRFSTGRRSRRWSAAVAFGARQPPRREIDPPALRRASDRPRAVSSCPIRCVALARAARADVRVAGGDDREGRAARPTNHRGPSQLPSAHRPVEDHGNPPGYDRRELVHSVRHRQVSSSARPVTVSRGAARTLVVVAKAPRIGHVKTRLGGTLAPEAIVALYRCLIEDTLDLAGSLPDTHVAVVCPPADVGELRAWLDPITEIGRASCRERV